MSLVLHQARYDLLSFSRNREARFFTIVLPLIFLVVFAAIFGNDTVDVNGHEIKQTTYYVPNLMALAITSAVCCGASSGRKNTAPGIFTRVTLGAGSSVARSASVRPPSPFSAWTTHAELPDAASRAAGSRSAAM